MLIKLKNRVSDFALRIKQNKSLVNIIYLAFDKLIRLGLGLIVFTMIARYFGPEKFGLINYSFSIVYIFCAISTLGMQGIIVRDLVDSRSVGLIIGTGFVVRFFSAIVLYPISILTVIILRPDDSLVLYTTSILSLLIFFNNCEVFKYWFESKILYKNVVIVENAIFLLVSIVKLAMLYYLVEFEVYILTFAVESLIVCFAIFCLFKVKSGNTRLEYRFEEAKYLIKTSAPLIISAAAWVVYTRVDTLMVGNLLGDDYVGYYAAATKVSDIFNFIPIIIVSSFVPIIQKYRNCDQEVYLKKFQSLYDYTVSLMFIISLVVILSSDFVIASLFGVEYVNSASVLKMYIFVVVINGLGLIGGKYLLIDGMQKITMYRHLFGLLLNIPLNLLLIPIYGINGAAVATILSLFVSNYLLDYLFVETKVVFYQKTKSLLFVWLFRYICKKFEKLKR